MALIGGGNFHLGYNARLLGRTGIISTSERLKYILSFYPMRYASWARMHLLEALVNGDKELLLKSALQLLEVNLYEGLEQEMKDQVKNKFSK